MNENEKDWLALVTVHSELFSNDYCGYWLRGVDQDEKLGWLAWEDDEQHLFGDEPQEEKALKAWKEGRSLPEGWFRMDKALAKKAWNIGVREYGVHWYEDGDATTYDVVLQLALLGEVRYG